MSAILTIARRELAEGMRNRWVVSMTVVMAALAGTIAALGSAPTGSTATGALDVVVVTDNEREFSRVPGLKVENWLR